MAPWTMPKRPWPGLASKAASERSAQRSERRMDSAAQLSSTGWGVHSSSTMAMSAPKSAWISTARSGVSA